MISVKRSKWDKKIYLVFVGVYVVLAFSAIISGITSWDEETDYLGIRTQLAHAVQLVLGYQTNYRDIHSNLEYYGSVGLLPAWLFWFLQQGLLIGRLPLSKALFDPSAEHQLTGFFATSHFFLVCEFVLLSYLVVKIAKQLELRLPWIAGCLVLFHPSLVGHSFVNPKDIPFALFYTGYTYTLLDRRHSPRLFKFYLSLACASLLINQKFVAIAPVIISEVLLYITQSPCTRRLSRTLSLPLISLFMALALQPASWGLNPFTYLNEAFLTFSNHEWGGCMWYNRTCVGVNHPDWSTLRYIWNWLSIKLPFLWLILLSFQLLSCIFSPNIKIKSFVFSPWMLVISQITLIPVMAVLRQSNLYDADRHLLFIYPPLSLVAAAGFQSLIDLRISNTAKTGLRLFLSLCFIVLVIDVLNLNPYQSSYLNEISRLRHNHTTTSLDYWAVSSKELIRNSQIHGSLSNSPRLKHGVWISPFWIGFRQLNGTVSDDDSLPSPLFQLRDVPSFSSHESRPCKFDTQVNRSLLFAKPLILSRLYLCED